MKLPLPAQIALLFVMCLVYFTPAVVVWFGSPEETRLQHALITYVVGLVLALLTMLPCLDCFENDARCAAAQPAAQPQRAAQQPPAPAPHSAWSRVFNNPQTVETAPKASVNPAEARQRTLPTPEQHMRDLDLQLQMKTNQLHLTSNSKEQQQTQGEIDRLNLEKASVNQALDMQRRVLANRISVNPN